MQVSSWFGDIYIWVNQYPWVLWVQPPRQRVDNLGFVGAINPFFRLALHAKCCNPFRFQHVNAPIFAGYNLIKSPFLLVKLVKLVKVHLYFVKFELLLQMSCNDPIAPRFLWGFFYKKRIQNRQCERLKELSHWKLTGAGGDGNETAKFDPFSSILQPFVLLYFWVI